jgi:hypothetical protein
VTALAPFGTRFRAVASHSTKLPLRRSNAAESGIAMRKRSNQSVARCLCGEICPIRDRENGTRHRNTRRKMADIAGIAIVGISHALESHSSAPGSPTGDESRRAFPASPARESICTIRDVLPTSVLKADGVFGRTPRQ